MADNRFSKYLITPDLIERQIQAESRGDPKAVGPMTPFGTAKGLAQVIDSTAADPGFGIAPLKNQFDPVDSRRFMTEYMTALVKRYNGNVAHALAGYNWGMGNKDNPRTDAWVKRGAKFDELPMETQLYIREIMGEASLTQEEAKTNRFAKYLPPAPAPTAQPKFQPTPFPNNTVPEDATPEEVYLHSTSLGRVMDAVGEGIADGLHTDVPLGLSEENVKKLQNAGFFPRPGSTNLLKYTYKAFLGGGVALLDLFTRALMGTAYGAAQGIGQIVAEVPIEGEFKGRRFARTQKTRFTAEARGKATTRFLGGFAEWRLTGGIASPIPSAPRMFLPA
ncbi:MAG: lytic transglycosylase domain-containing protein, partial [Nitrososphaera sp.]|nr:lytic transglycosylase domain-containing protein [Nitrososphaera sp.]